MYMQSPSDCQTQIVASSPHVAKLSPSEEKATCFICRKSFLEVGCFSYELGIDIISHNVYSFIFPICMKKLCVLQNTLP